MASPSNPAGVAERIVALALDRPPALGEGRLVCVDGPAGSGKTTLSRRLASLTGGTVIHMDDLYDGWTGLDALPEQLASIVEPLSRGLSGSYRRYDWIAGQYAETVTVPPGPWLILEGVGSGARALADVTSVLVHIDAPAQMRLERGLERDGRSALPHWERWMIDEARLFDRERPADRADVHVNGAGELDHYSHG